MLSISLDSRLLGGNGSSFVIAMLVVTLADPRIGTLEGWVWASSWTFIWIYRQHCLCLPLSQFQSYNDWLILETIPNLRRWMDCWPQQDCNANTLDSVSYQSLQLIPENLSPQSFRNFLNYYLCERWSHTWRSKRSESLVHLHYNCLFFCVPKFELSLPSIVSGMVRNIKIPVRGVRNSDDSSTPFFFFLRHRQNSNIPRELSFKSSFITHSIIPDGSSCEGAGMARVWPEILPKTNIAGHSCSGLAMWFI